MCHIIWREGHAVQKLLYPPIAKDSHNLWSGRRTLPLCRELKVTTPAGILPALCASCLTLLGSQYALIGALPLGLVGLVCTCAYLGPKAQCAELEQRCLLNLSVYKQLCFVSKHLHCYRPWQGAAFTAGCRRGLDQEV